MYFHEQIIRILNDSLPRDPNIEIGKIADDIVEMLEAEGILEPLEEEYE